MPCTTLHCTTLYQTALHYTKLHLNVGTSIHVDLGITTKTASWTSRPWTRSNHCIQGRTWKRDCRQEEGEEDEEVGDEIGHKSWQNWAKDRRRKGFLTLNDFTGKWTIFKFYLFSQYSLPLKTFFLFIDISINGILGTLALYVLILPKIPNLFLNNVTSGISRQSELDEPIRAKTNIQS